jgi:uncharacterized membrane protein
MKIRAGELAQLIITAATFFAAFYFHPFIPERMASHWNARGVVNGWMPKTAGMFFMPGLSVFVFLTFLVIARVKVKGKSIDDFRDVFEIFAVVVLAFMLYVSLLVIAYNMNIVFDMGTALAPGFAALIFSMGKLMDGCKTNYLVGIRTSLTLRNEKVWEKTHKMGAQLFYAASGITLFGMVFPGFLLFFMLVPMAVIPLYLAGYSKKIYNEEISQDGVNK